jgi:hypothetical protein
MSDEQPSVISRIAADKPSEWNMSKLWGGVAGVIGLLVWFGLGRFEPAVVAEAAGYSAVVIVFTGWLFWSSLSGRRFWFFMTAVVAMHGVVLFTVPWPVHYETSKRDMLFLIGDFILTGGLGALVVRLTRRPE